MKNLKNKTLFLVFICLFCLSATAFSKDPVKTIHLPKEIKWADGTETYSYDKNFRLTSVVYNRNFASGRVQLTFNVKYEKNGTSIETAEINTYMSQDGNAKGFYNKYNFKYVGNNITRTLVSMDFQPATRTEVDELEVNEKGFIVKSLNSRKQTATYEYDANGNMIKINKEYTEHTSKTLDVTEKTTFMYDDKKGIYSDIIIPQWFMFYHFDNPEATFFKIDRLNKFNNMTFYEELTTRPDSSAKKTTISYTNYDKDGYPIAFESTFYDDKPIKATIKYDIKEVK